VIAGRYYFRLLEKINCQQSFRAKLLQRLATSQIPYADQQSHTNSSLPAWRNIIANP
jgi:hypothetical protein